MLLSQIFYLSNIKKIYSPQWYHNRTITTTAALATHFNDKLTAMRSKSQAEERGRRRSGSSQNTQLSRWCVRHLTHKTPVKKASPYARQRRPKKIYGRPQDTNHSKLMHTNCWRDMGGNRTWCKAPTRGVLHHIRHPMNVDNHTDTKSAMIRKKISSDPQSYCV